MTALPCVPAPEPDALPGADHERWRYVADAFGPAPRHAAAFESASTPTAPLPDDVLTLTFGEHGRLIGHNPHALGDAGVLLSVLEREEAALLFPRAGLASDPAAQGFYGPAPSFAYRLRVTRGTADVPRKLAVIRRAEGTSGASFALAIELEPGARLELHERYMPAERAAGHAPSVMFSAFTATLGAGASLDMSLTHCGFPEARICAAERAEMGANAAFRRYVTALGGRAFKLETSAYLTGEAATAEYRAALFGDGERFADLSPFMYHRAPKTDSFVGVRQLLRDRARAVFYGLADIPEDAPGCRAEQRHRCLLTSDRAKAYARPQLDIRTNDVTCCHGSATGGPDPDALFYLSSRGFNEQEAAHLLAEAFLAPTAEDVPQAEAREAQAELIRAALRRASPVPAAFTVPGHE